MSMVQEFKQFAMKGNVMDMAIGIIIGGAFGKIVSSLVTDVLMPPIGKLMGGVDFSNLFVTLDSAKGPFKTLADAKAGGVATINYGLFINTIIDFVIVALAIFLMMKGMNAMRRKEEANPTTSAEPPADVKLLTEIRDLLKK
ncbi:MAG: large conductance mechanosensitive channel protein MscL [bacterium]